MTAAKKKVSERDEALAAEGYPLVAWQARRMGKLPPGINVEDLESVGGEALQEAILTYDEASGVGFRVFARTVIKSRMLTAVGQAREAAKKRVPLQIVGRDGNSTPLPADKRADDPGLVAEARDEWRGKQTTTVATIARSLPSPEQVADRVHQLRGAMFRGIDPDGIERVMRKLMEQAEGGDLKATRLLIDMLAPKTSGVTVLQENVTIRTTEAR